MLPGIGVGGDNPKDTRFINISPLTLNMHFCRKQHDNLKNLLLNSTQLNALSAAFRKGGLYASCSSLTHPGTRGNILIPTVLPVPAPGLRSGITHRVKKRIWIFLSLDQSKSKPVKSSQHFSNKCNEIQGESGLQKRPLGITMTNFFLHIRGAEGPK